MNTNNEIEDLFKYEFENWELTPPSSVKNNIDKNIVFNQKTRFRFFFGLIFMFFCLTISAFYFFLNDIKAEQKFVNNKNNSSSINISNIKNQNVNKLYKNNNNYSVNYYKYKKYLQKKPFQSQIKKNIIIDNLLALNENRMISNTYKNNNYSEINDIFITKNITENINSKMSYFDSYIEEFQNVVALNDTISKKIDALKNYEEMLLIIDAKNVLEINDSIYNSQRFKKNKEHFPFMLSLNAGTIYSKSIIAKNSNQLNSKDRNALSTSVFFTFPIKNHFGVLTGINYQKYKTTYSYYEMIKEQKLKGVEYLTNQTIDSAYIIQYSNRFDTVYFMHTDTINNKYVYEDYYRKENVDKSIKFSSFNIPFMIYYEHNLFKNIFLDTYLGAALRLNTYKYVSVSTSEKQWFTNYSAQIIACLNTNIRFQWNKYGIGLGNNFSFVSKENKIFDIKRKKIAYELNIGLFYKF